MKALTWQGKRKVTVEDVPDPVIQEPTDAIVRITSTAICGSDLHLYELFGPYLDAGDILGHEPMGVVVEVGSGISQLAVGDRVVIPFNISCGTCFMCRKGLQSQCETTQVREYGSGASLFGYTKLYGQVPGGQAEYLRVPLADYNHIKVGSDLPDDRYLFLSDILPTAWQGVDYAHVPDGGTLAVMGLGPVGQFAARVGVHRGYRVLAVDPVPERRAMAQRHGVETFDLTDAIVDELRDATDGRGPDSVVDAVGLEAHRQPGGQARSRCDRAPSRPGGPGRHGEGRSRPPGGAARVHRCGPSRRHGLHQRGLCRRGRHPSDEDDVRQAGLDPHGAVQRQAVGRRPASSRGGSRRPVRCHGPRHPPRTAHRCPRSLRDLPEEGRRLHQGPLATPPRFHARSRLARIRLRDTHDEGRRE